MKRGPVKGALDREASYMYYLHGPLMRTEIGDLSVQGVDFAYTLHGWIKGVNSGTLKSDRDIGQDGEDGSDNEMVARDVYGYGLGYYRNDYTAIGQSSGDLTTTTFFMPALPTNSNYHSTVPELWNGNIRHMLTAIKPFLGGSGEPQGMSYTYDQLNRIQTSRAWVTINATGNTWQAGGGALDKYKEDYTYDGNGNIQTLTRYAINGAGTTRMMDYFGYNYVSGTNKLAYVTDTVSSSAFTVDIDNQMGGNYDYDEIGNLIKDVSEEIDIIEWNVYGKIKAVTRGIMSTKPDLEFEYDPMGNRVLKRVITKGMSPRTIETLYIRDANGNEMASYTLAGDSVTWNSASIYGSSRLGLYEQDQLLEVDSISVLTLPSDERIVWRGYRKYELSNHLGNVLVVISDKRTTVCDGSNNVLYYEAEIVSAQDYYPFGMVMPGREYASVEYKYAFNGKEKDAETSTGAIAFEARIFDARMARFFSIDPRQVEYPWQAPFAYFRNSPIGVIDVFGMGGEEKPSPPVRPKQSDRPWKTRADLPWLLRVKYDKYVRRYNQMKSDNPIGDNENIKDYEDRIAKQMMSTYGSRRWMFYKTNSTIGPNNENTNSSSPNASGHTTYLWVGGLAIPENSSPVPAVPLNLTANGVGPNGGSWSTAGATGNVSLTVQNNDATNPASISISYSEPGSGSTQLATDQTIPANGTSSALTFNSNGAVNGNIFMTWNMSPSSPGLTFVFQLTPPPIRTYPIIIPIQSANKRISRQERAQLWTRTHANKTIWR